MSKSKGGEQQVKQQYSELAKAKIQEKRNLVISEKSEDRGFILAQQIEIKEGKKLTTVFVKGAIHVDDLDGLYELRDAINESITKIESKK